MEQRNENKTELKMIKMSDVQSQTVDWLWYPFIPYGKLTIIQGDPGDGKTTLILNIAARLSKGEGLDLSLIHISIIAGMGELHLEIIVDRLLREFKVEANVCLLYTSSSYRKHWKKFSHRQQKSAII